ncbi:hypothetical protein DOTSEDRAFT_72216 [Dothistroma septosporum NZE10]|uniref:Uncharacterized protein n=1 Tax=Dothistroma septosporum (strain NZE10 / CBS 128990) TaxID=675120 RepID=N1PMM6_DOTSN|nr:hypothetical protein DOTSEDRAFT_72216 [Dothistroma septosporum NZE10]
MIASAVYTQRVAYNRAGQHSRHGFTSRTSSSTPFQVVYDGSDHEPCKRPPTILARPGCYGVTLSKEPGLAYHDHDQASRRQEFGSRRCRHFWTDSSTPPPARVSPKIIARNRTYRAEESPSPRSCLRPCTTSRVSLHDQAINAIIRSVLRKSARSPRRHDKQTACCVCTSNDRTGFGRLCYHEELIRHQCVSVS